jgi:ParB family chromosome partitioning protein
LLKLPDNIQIAIRENEISMGHARAIINIEDQDDQQYLFHKIVEEGLTVRDIENLVRQAQERAVEKKNNLPAKKKIEIPPAFGDMQKTLSEKLGLKIKIKADERGRGSLVIPFKSQHDIKRLIDLL